MAEETGNNGENENNRAGYIRRAAIVASLAADDADDERKGRG